MPHSEPPAEDAANRGAVLRFAFVTTFYPPFHFGGDALFVRTLAHALARRGHQVEVIHDVGAFRALGGDAASPLAEPSGVRVHRLESRWPRLASLVTHQTGRPLVHRRRLRRLLAPGAHDVIHYHNVSLVGGADVLAYGDGVKLYTAHEHWLVCPTHILWRHRREPCTGRQCLRCSLRHHRPPQLWRRTGFLERRAAEVDVFCSPSRFSVQKHREFGFAPELEVLPLFLPSVADPPPPMPRGLPSGTPFFLFAGRLEPIKGVEDLARAFLAAGPAELWVAGRGSSEGALRRLAARGARLRLLGNLASDSLRALYARCLAVVVPSRCFEVFPLVLLEAFREGAPVVARRLGPFPEILEESGAGLLFDGPDELASTLGRLATEADLRRDLGRAARRAFATRWSEPVGLQRYFELILRAAGRRGAPRILQALEGSAAPPARRADCG